MGVERPSDTKLKLDIDPEILVPVYDLEQVSPDSVKSHSNEPRLSCPISNENYNKYQSCTYFDGKHDDLESPAFEPIEQIAICKTNFVLKPDVSDSTDDMDISDGDDEPIQQIEVKSNVSSISGLTSNDSNNSFSYNSSEKPQKIFVGENQQLNVNVMTKNIAQTNENCLAPEISLSSAVITLPLTENIISNTSDLIIDHINQDSILSQVSSTSRLSIVTNNTNSQLVDGDVKENELHVTHVNSVCPFELSEEAQMQKFNENLYSENSQHITSNKSDAMSDCSEHTTNFDIKKENIKFEGTVRKLSEIYKKSYLSQLHSEHEETTFNDVHKDNIKVITDGHKGI